MCKRAIGFFAVFAIWAQGCSEVFSPQSSSSLARPVVCDPSPMLGAYLAAEDGTALRTSPAPRPLRWSYGTLGIEFGTYSFRKDAFTEWFDEAPYIGLRYALELSLNAALSLSGGYFRFPTEVVDGEDIDGVPIKAQLELGSYLGPTQCRWYISAGGGYNICQKRPSEGLEDLWPALPPIDMGWIYCAAAGLEFRNSTRISARVEFGHTWMADSGADMWTSTGVISYQF